MFLKMYLPVLAFRMYLAVYMHLYREVWEVDVEWVGFVVTGGWLVTLPAAILGLILGDQTPWRRVILLKSPCHRIWDLFK